MLFLISNIFKKLRYSYDFIWFSTKNKYIDIFWLKTNKNFNKKLEVFMPEKEVLIKNFLDIVKTLEKCAVITKNNDTLFILAAILMLCEGVYDMDVTLFNK